VSYGAVGGEVGGNGKSARGPSGCEVSAPNPEAPAHPTRRRFSAAHKARTVEAAAGCTQAGEIGALLRWEGLYSSQLSQWRQQYRAGALEALRDDRQGRKAVKHSLEDENGRLRKQNARLERRLEQAETIIEIPKKCSSVHETAACRRLGQRSSSARSSASAWRRRSAMARARRM